MAAETTAERQARFLLERHSEICGLLREIVANTTPAPSKAVAKVKSLLPPAKKSKAKK